MTGLVKEVSIYFVKSPSRQTTRRFDQYLNPRTIPCSPESNPTCYFRVSTERLEGASDFVRPAAFNNLACSLRPARVVSIDPSPIEKPARHEVGSLDRVSQSFSPRHPTLHCSSSKRDNHNSNNVTSVCCSQVHLHLFLHPHEDPCSCRCLYY